MEGLTLWPPLPPVIKDWDWKRGSETAPTYWSFPMGKLNGMALNVVSRISRVVRTASQVGTFFSQSTDASNCDVSPTVSPVAELPQLESRAACVPRRRSR